MNPPVAKSKFMKVISVVPDHTPENRYGVERMILFDSDQETADKMKGFGVLAVIDPDRYALTVSRKYNFEDVAEYVRSFEENTESMSENMG